MASHSQRYKINTTVSYEEIEGSQILLKFVWVDKLMIVLVFRYFPSVSQGCHNPVFVEETLDLRFGNPVQVPPWLSRE